MQRNAIVIGGAGGIGLALATRLSHRGYRLVLVDIDAARLAASADRIGGGVVTVQADLTVDDDLTRILDLIERDPHLELLVNSAGTVKPGDVIDLSFDDLERHIDINLLAPMRLIQAAARVMSARGTGCILSVVSAAGLVALPGSAAYSASKFGLRGFMMAISEELKQRGVKVRGVYPGAVDTLMLRYEATHGGSVFNFLNKDVLSVDQVADACLRSIDGDRLEIILPFWDGVTVRVLGVAPGFMRYVLPMLRKKGEKGLRRFLGTRGLSSEQETRNG